MTSIFLERSFLASTWTFFSHRVSNFRLSILFRKYDIEFYIAPHHFFFLFLLPLLRRSSREQTTASCSFSPASWPVCFTCFDFVSFVFSRNIPTFQITLELVRLVSKESLLSATMYRNGNFGLVFGRGEMLLTYMIFVYHWTSLVSRTSRKI